MSVCVVYLQVGKKGRRSSSQRGELSCLSGKNIISIGFFRSTALYIVGHIEVVDELNGR